MVRSRGPPARDARARTAFGDCALHNTRGGSGAVRKERAFYDLPGLLFVFRRMRCFGFRFGGSTWSAPRITLSNSSESMLSSSNLFALGLHVHTFICRALMRPGPLLPFLRTSFCGDILDSAREKREAFHNGKYQCLRLPRRAACSPRPSIVLLAPLGRSLIRILP